MSWGTKIAILYCSFVLMIVVLVVKSSGEKVDLVSADYYAQELKFQDKIDGQNNMNELNGKIEFEAKDKAVHIKFPNEFIGNSGVGEIYFYRPSDSALDFSKKLKIDEKGSQLIHNENFKRGIYRMQIKCALNGKSYYYEQQIFMN